MDPYSRASKKNTSYGNEMLPQVVINLNSVQSRFFLILPNNFINFAVSATSFHKQIESFNWSDNFLCTTGTLLVFELEESSKKIV